MDKDQWERVLELAREEVREDSVKAVRAQVQAVIARARNAGRSRLINEDSRVR